MKTDLTFWALLHRYTGRGKKRRLFTISELLISIVIAAAVAFVLGAYADNLPEATRDLAGSIFAAAGSLLGVVLAGFAISAAITDAGFSAFLFKYDKLVDILSPFWFCSALWGLTTGVSGLVYVFTYITPLTMWFPTAAGLGVLSFGLSLSFTLSLVGNTLRTGYYRAMYQVGSEPETESKDLEGR
jgi:hypothetical protein